MIQFFRPLRTFNVVAFVTSLLVMWLTCPFLGRVPLLVLAVGLLLYTAHFLFQRLQSGHREQAIAALLVISFYVCSALTSVKPEELTAVRSASDAPGFYPALTESFLQFKLNLPVQPDARLLKAANPYVPGRDYPFVWDACYFQGQYYVYHGIAPILTLFLPFRLITGQPLPIQFALLVFVIAGFIGSLCVLERARRVCGFEKKHAFIQVLSVLLLGFASMGPLVLRRPSVYEVAIGSAYCYSMWAAFFLIGQFERRDVAGALLASLCVGLCIGSRPTYGVMSGLLLIALVLQVRSHWREERWLAVARSLSLVVPLGLIGFVLGLYNRLRFGSWTEFGLHYQLDHLDMYNMRLDPQKMWHATAYYLFSKPLYSNHFPGVRANLTTQPFHLGRHAGIHEDVLGVFSTMPVCYILGISPFVAWLRRSRGLIVFTFVLIGFACLMMLAVSNIGLSVRYELDFVPALLLASTLVFYGVSSRLKPQFRILAEAFWVPAVCFSVMIGVLGSLSDVSGHTLETYHPTTFQLIRHLTWPAGPAFDAQK